MLQQTHVALFIQYEKAFPQKLFAYQTPDKIPSLTEMTVENCQTLTLILLVPCHTKIKEKEEKGRESTPSTTTQLPFWPLTKGY